MTIALQNEVSTKYKRGLLFVFMAGVLWSTMGLGIRMIEDATVWQILLYRSVSLSAFLAIVIYLRSKVSPVAIVFKSNPTSHIAGMSLVAGLAAAHGGDNPRAHGGDNPRAHGADQRTYAPENPRAYGGDNQRTCARDDLRRAAPTHGAA